MEAASPQGVEMSSVGSPVASPECESPPNPETVADLRDDFQNVPNNESRSRLGKFLSSKIMGKGVIDNSCKQHKKKFSGPLSFGHEDDEAGEESDQPLSDLPRLAPHLAKKLSSLAASSSVRVRSGTNRLAEKVLSPSHAVKHRNSQVRIVIGAPLVTPSLRG